MLRSLADTVQKAEGVKGLLLAPVPTKVKMTVCWPAIDAWHTNVPEAPGARVVGLVPDLYQDPPEQE
jgi:hypothetical protein